MTDQEALRDQIARAVAEKFTSPTRSVRRDGNLYDPETFEDYTEPVPMDERIAAGAWVSFIAEDGYTSIRSANASEIADAVLPIVTQREAALRQRIADYLPTHAGGDETDPWQAGHNYAMREAARLIQERHDTL